MRVFQRIKTKAHYKLEMNKENFTFKIGQRQVGVKIFNLEHKHINLKFVLQIDARVSD